ncbi:MAG: hypothetical protein A2383_00990 [Candidatus Pacebacteria bacterium RIFOXYB1_FULL_39_46]|nr:MAG: hypothetical protein A2182_00825 [Candidatus Pacebacteria bacterium RIFOXYA1_FULL_38_18]OGJ38157.1 MAG: hypothetical protein A2383_00990 [Candidatus Pacebacteria bacterium RIFOXYB1_FULL_39_46]OGJ39621.1 MAG: hypothetical protein A2411_02450 [Candidatus Pacebacteria bacterium RIFOXYC1_FULL_39_21]OGJ39909.1 MAG: hypothetical protein A2582_00755 [Candidatus Pacebacteria bacterium RIFOXYD1_FULL_39_27]
MLKNLIERLGINGGQDIDGNTPEEYTTAHLQALQESSEDPNTRAWAKRELERRRKWIINKTK